MIGSVLDRRAVARVPDAEDEWIYWLFLITRSAN